MLSLLAFLYLQSFQPALTAPLPNNTALDTEVAPPWVDDPSGRGTWNLLYSCGFTLVLCVWTSIHLNVPPPHESAWLAWRRKLKWVVIALFAPEAVVFTAFQQWLTATCFLKELKRIAEAKPYKKSDQVDAAPAEYSFDMVYAYYAVMGGFAVKIDHLHNTLDQATLTTNALLLLAQHGHFIGLSRELISDKSKANYLAKGLVCLQVLWVAGQAIERKLAGFPISLLEFHTLVHIFCALVLYTLWIRKPYDINEPTIVPTEGFPNALAYIVASSRWAGSSGFQKILRPTDSKRNIFFAMFYPNPDPEFIFYRDLGATPQVWFDEIRNIYVPLEMSDDRIRNLIICARYQENTPKPEGCNTTAYVTKAGSTLPEPPFFPGECIQKRYKPANNDQGVLTLSSGQALKSGLGPKEYWELDHADGKLNYGPGISITLSQKDFNRLDMAGTFIQGLIEGRKSESLFQASFSHPQFNDIDSAIFQPFGGGTIRPYGDTMICARQSNWFDFDMTFFNTFGKLSDLYSWILYTLAIVIIPAAYGGIHLGAVHTLFPSEIELTLWKSSCFILLGVAGLPVLGVPGIFAFFEAFRLLDEYMPDAMKPRLRIMRSWIEKYGVAFLSSYVVLSLLAFIVCIVLVPVVLLYVAARLFIVVESFISLRHVPIGVYRTPNTNFTSYIPHL